MGVTELVRSETASHSGVEGEAPKLRSWSRVSVVGPRRRAVVLRWRAWVLRSFDSPRLGPRWSNGVIHGEGMDSRAQRGSDRGLAAATRKR